MADLEGTLETCGCTSRALTSIDRLAAAIGAARPETNASLVLAVGQLFSPAAGLRPSREQDRLRLALLDELLPRIGINVAAPALSDVTSMRPHVDQLQTSGVKVLARAPFQSSEPSRTLQESVVIRVGSVDVGIVTAVDLDRQRELANDVRHMRESGAQLTIVLAQDQLDTSTFTSEDAPDLILVVEPGQDVASQRAQQPSPKVLQIPKQARGLLVIDVDRAAPTSPPAFQVQAFTVTLTADSPGDLLLRAELEGLFEKVNAYNGKQTYEAADLSVAGRQFDGSDTCAACHTGAYLWWKTTPHARAFATLERRRRQLDLDCIGCHVTGFQQAGGATPTAHEHVEGVGCESCHGPGSRHANDPTAAHSIERAVQEQVCAQCHDRQHHAEFVYQASRARLLTAAHGDK